MPHPARTTLPASNPEAIASAADLLRSDGTAGFRAAQALARQEAPEMVAFLIGMVRQRLGSLFGQQRAAALVLETAGLVRKLPPGSAGTEAEGEAAAEGEGG